MDPASANLSERSVAAVWTVVGPIITAAAMIIMSVAAVVGDRVAGKSGSGGTGHGHGRIDRLDRAAGRVIGGHAAHAGTDGKQQKAKDGPAGNDGFCFHT